MVTAALSTPPVTRPLVSFEQFAISRARIRAILLVAVTILALGVCIASLSTYGLSEDEINKVRAVEEYRHGHFGANGEHPMLMKLAIWGSVELAGAWNRVGPPTQPIPLEAAVRLPNALAGAATTAALFGLSEVLFGGCSFFVLAMWCYERVKKQGAHRPPSWRESTERISLLRCDAGFRIPRR